MRLIILMILFAGFSMPTWAISISTNCPSSTSKAIPKDTTVFFYQRFKSKKIFYIPILVMKEGKLSGIGKMLMPSEVTIYNARDDKPVKIQFKNTYNAMENACQSIGEVEAPSVIKPRPPTELYANKSISSAFNFNPEQADVARFEASIKDPCRPGQPNYDSNGVALCNADKLIATSNLANQKQYWQLRQYRYDVGIVINLWNEQDRKFKPIAEDCTVCSD